MVSADKAMTIHGISKKQFQSLIDCAHSALLKAKLPSKRTRVQDTLSMILTGYDRKYSSLLSDWGESELKRFDFNIPEVADEDMTPEMWDAIYPCIEDRMIYRYQPVCLKGSMEPRQIVGEDDGMFRLKGDYEFYEREELGLFVSFDASFIEDNRAFIRSNDVAVFYEVRDNFEDDEDDSNGYLVTLIFMEGTTDDIKYNTIYNPSRVYLCGDELGAFKMALNNYSSQSTSNVYLNKMEVFKNISLRQEPVRQYKDWFELIPQNESVSIVKAFLELHKQSESVPISNFKDPNSFTNFIWPGVWSIMVNEIKYSDHGELYINLSAQESKSGEPEVFKINSPVIEFLLAVDRAGISEWTESGVLLAKSYQEAETLFYFRTTEEVLSYDWAKMVLDTWMNPVKFKEVFYGYLSYT